MPQVSPAHATTRDQAHMRTVEHSAGPDMYIDPVFVVIVLIGYQYFQQFGATRRGKCGLKVKSKEYKWIYLPFVCFRL